MTNEYNRELFPYIGLDPDEEDMETYEHTMWVPDRNYSGCGCEFRIITLSNGGYRLQIEETCNMHEYSFVHEDEEEPPDIQETVNSMVEEHSAVIEGFLRAIKRVHGLNVGNQRFPAKQNEDFVDVEDIRLEVNHDMTEDGYSMSYRVINDGGW